IGHKFTLPETTVAEGVRWFSPGPTQSADLNSLFFESWILASIYEVGSEREYGEVLSAQAPVITGSSTNGTTIDYAGGPAPSIPDALRSLEFQVVHLAPTNSVHMRFDPLSQMDITLPRVLNATFTMYLSEVPAPTKITLGYRLNGSVFM